MLQGCICANKKESEINTPYIPSTPPKPVIHYLVSDSLNNADCACVNTERTSLALGRLTGGPNSSWIVERTVGGIWYFSTSPSEIGNLFPVTSEAIIRG